MPGRLTLCVLSLRANASLVPHLGPAAAAITLVPGLRVGVLLLLVLTDVMLRVRLAGDENLRPGRYASC
jgi:hypothetical protein